MILLVGKNKLVDTRESIVDREAYELWTMDARLRTKKRGFTLVEVMLSVAILSIGLVLILQGFASSLKALRICEDNLKATQAFANKLEEAQILAKEDWNKFAGGLSEKFEFAGLDCTWQLEVAPATWQTEELFPEYEDLNEVEAILNWQEGKRKGRIPLFTFMKKYADEED